MEIPATSDNIPGTLVLRDATGGFILKSASIVDADISATASISGDKLADGAINNAKVATNAAIAGSKIAPTFQTKVNINVPQGSSASAIGFNHNYTIFADNTGSGTNNTRLWFDSPSGGEIVLGPRLGSNFLSRTRIRSDLQTFETSAGEAIRITSTNTVGFGTTSPNAAAQVTITSTTRGFLPPRMTTTQRDAITSPPAGLMIYNTSTNKLNVRTASSWEEMTSA